MTDQADKLRKIIDSLKLRQDLKNSKESPVNKSKNARIITVTSGKGGVGKTNITINLAVAFSEIGLKVAIIDADFGLANIDVLFGIIPKYSLADVISGNMNILDVLADGPQNIKFISGGSGVEELIKLNTEQLQKFMDNISLLDKIFDIILIDTGAGLSDNVMKFVMASDEVLLVTTPEPTSITDAYALIKMVSNRDNKKVIKIIVNRAENEQEALDVINRLKLVSEKFLRIKLTSTGYVQRDEMVIKAVKQQQPFTIRYPKSQASKSVSAVALKLLASEILTPENRNFGAKRFVSRLVKLFT